MEAPADLPLPRHAFVRALQRGDVAAVERFVTHPTVREVTDRADRWLADQGRWRLVEAGWSQAIQNITTRLAAAMQAAALAEERADDSGPSKRARLSAGDCVPWYLDEHGELTLRWFGTRAAAYDVAEWLMRSSILEMTPYTALLVLSTIAFEAVEYGDSETLELVLGASVWRYQLARDDQADFIDSLARAWAERRGQPHDRATDVANVLLAHGVGVESVQANVELSDENFCRFLVGHGADIVGLDRLHVRSSSSTVSNAYLYALERAGVDPRAGGPFAFHRILSTGSEEAIRKLVGEWCLDLDVRLPEIRGFTPLMFAASSSKREMVRMLLDNGADVMATDAGGRSALALAASLGRRFIVEELLKRGADPHHVDSEKRTVMDHAMSRRPPCKHVLALLREHGATSSRRTRRRSHGV